MQTHKLGVIRSPDPSRPPPPPPVRLLRSPKHENSLNVLFAHTRPGHDVGYTETGWVESDVW